MNQEELRNIMREFYGSPLTFLEVEDADTRVKMKKPAGPQADSVPMSAHAEEIEVVQAPGEFPEASRPEASPNREQVSVRSPLVGVFYEAPSPGEDPFVRPGQHVEEGDVLCLVEAMKMMNEIKAPRPGTVRWIAVENAATVGFDDLIMEIEAD